MKQYRNAYYPGFEELESNEIRVTALGTGMPALRPSQMSPSWFVELGNGDKFFFDLGTGSISRFCALGISYNDANKVFLSHLHSDHVGDFAALFIGGWIEGRQSPLRIWGPSGDSPEMGTKHFIDRQIDAYKWDITSRASRRSVEGKTVQVNEFDPKGENKVVYDENGVVIRSWPAVHAIAGPVSFGLEWNGLKFVYGGDTGPNKWFLEYAKNADLLIHECFITVPFLTEKFGFSRKQAVEVGTRVHTSPEAFGKVLTETSPRMGIAYHFFNDTETAPRVYDEVRKSYSGQISFAKDLMVWNVTPDQIKVRHTIYNPDSWPTLEKGLRPPEELTWEKPYPMPDWLTNGRLSWPDVDKFD